MRARAVRGRQGRGHVAAIMLAVLGNVQPGQGGVPAALQRDGVPGALSLGPPSEPREGPRAVDGDALVAVRITGVRRPLQRRVEAGQGFLVTPSARVGTPESAEVARVHGAGSLTRRAGRGQVRGQHAQQEGHGNDVLAVVLEHLAEQSTVP